jgi:hypothetical protein
MGLLLLLLLHAGLHDDSQRAEILRQVAMVTAAGFPCGHCRQFLSELVGVDGMSFLAAHDETRCHTMQQLLPGGMRPAALADGRPPELGDSDDQVAAVVPPSMDSVGKSLFDGTAIGATSDQRLAVQVRLVIESRWPQFASERQRL